jgi:hypothetical protein
MRKGGGFCVAEGSQVRLIEKHDNMYTSLSLQFSKLLSPQFCSREHPQRTVTACRALQLHLTYSDAWKFLNQTLI